VLARNEPLRFQALRSFLDRDDRETLYHENFRARLQRNAEEYLSELYDTSLPSDYDRAFLADFVSYLPEDLLVKVDRASMAHGLECRSPLLDQELVAFAAALPAEWKIDGARSKRILKDAVAPWFPPGFVERRKMGFSVPIGNWFRDELRSYIRHRLLEGSLSQKSLLRRDGIARLLDEHFSGGRNHETQIWNLLMLDLWLEEYGANL